MTDIPGSKPKKLIRRTNFSNPSLVSNSVTGLFNPEIVLVNQQRERIKRSNSNISGRLSTPIKRSSSQQIYNLDSLHKAEDEFLRKKLSNPYIELNRNKMSPQKSPQQIKKKNTEYHTSMGLSSLSYLNNLNYINFNSIRNKQKHGYDIINNVPSEKHY